jgi:hypothetical protein
MHLLEVAVWKEKEEGEKRKLMPVRDDSPEQTPGRLMS